MITANDENLGDGIIDCAAALERFDGDIQLLREVAALFLEDIPRRLFELRWSLTRGDGKAVARIAHSFRGSVSNVGAAAAAEAALRVETLALRSDLSAAREACAALEEAITRLQPALARLASVDGAAGGAAVL
jgi:HPt (histidine-containing phosphotransfer) domain-containing protein